MDKLQYWNEGETIPMDWEEEENEDEEEEVSHLDIKNVEHDPLYLEVTKLVKVCCILTSIVVF